jgi:excisionase family DNA binding protein
LTKREKIFIECIKMSMDILTAAQAAERLGVSVRRVQQLVKEGRLPAEQFGGAWMIKE